MRKALVLGIWLTVLLVPSIYSQTTTVVIPELEAAVTIRRDARGIPYIEAKNDQDLYFAQGYVTASDRLWQMDLLRRVARGETAEIFGDKALEPDKYFRRFGFAKVADESLAMLSLRLREALKDYARGVNAYIATLNDTTLPLEFQILRYKPRQWTPSDTIVIGKILAVALSTTSHHDLLRASLRGMPADKLANLANQVTPYDVILFGKDVPFTRASKTPRQEVSAETLAAAARDEQLRTEALAMVGLYSEDLAASNNWVISGKRTANGKAILANDPHLDPSAPGIWYLTHLSTPDIRVSGVTFPGVPGIVLGHNEFIAWGATNVGPDVQDLYLETLNEKGEVKTPTGWEPAKVRKEHIRVRTGFITTETKVVDLDVTETRNGVIVSEEGGKKYALKWTARDPKNAEFEAFFALNRARSWTDFKNALKTYGGATQNFVYADAKGKIGWYAAGRIPIRRTGDGTFPYDGSTNEGDWTGYIPFEQLPNLYDPPSGLIVTANQRVVGTSYKYTQMSRDASPPWRARRIYDLLSGKSNITMDDVRDVQHDAFNIPLSNLAREIVKSNAASAESIAILKDWDGKMTPDSRGAVLANEIRGCLANIMADDNRPAPAYVIRERILDWAVRDKAQRWLPSKFKSYEDLLRSCDASSRSALADPRRLGPDDTKWVWGATWRSRFPHPLAAVPFIGAQFATPSVPISGSGQTPNVGSAVSMRHIASPGNWDATRHVIPLGQSGDPRSPHFKDQFNAWASGEPMVFPFTKAAVEKASTSLLTLSPR